MHTRLLAPGSNLLLCLALSGCGAREAPITPQVTEPAPGVTPENVVFYAGDNAQKFPPVKREDVRVLALEGPELPPGFMRGGKQLVLADDVPSREAPHQAIEVLYIREVFEKSPPEEVINALVEVGRKHGATAIVHHGCAPLTVDCRATAVRLSTAAPPEAKRPPPTPTATWPAPTTVPAVPTGRVVHLPHIASVGAISAIDADRAIVAGTADVEEDGASQRWIGRIAKTGKLDFKLLGPGNVYDAQARPDGSVVLSGTGAAEVKKGNIEKTVEAAWVGNFKPDNKLDWEQSFVAEMNARADGVALLPSGGAVAAGLRIPQILGRCDALLSVVDGKGQTAWDSTVAGSGYQFFSDVAVLASGRFMAVGAVETSASKNLYDGWILVTEPGGEVITKRGVGRSGWNKFMGVTGLHDGGAVAVGQSTATGLWRRAVGSALVLRLDANGERIWEQTIGDKVVEVTDVIEVQGGVMFAATKLEEKGDQSSWLVKVDLDGKDTWEPIKIGGQYHVRDLAVSPDGGLVLVAEPERSSREIWVGRSGPR